MDLNWLEGYSCINIVRHEYSWAFVFDKGCSLTVECPWRIIANGRIAVAHNDHHQKFGHSQPIDAALHMHLT